jgi:hypothetical protein
VAERGNSPLHREPDPRAPVGQEILTPDAVEERGGEVAAAGAAAEEKELAHHGGHALVVVLAVLVAPVGQHGTDLSDPMYETDPPLNVVPPKFTELAAKAAPSKLTDPPLNVALPKLTLPLLKMAPAKLMCLPSKTVPVKSKLWPCQEWG